MSNLKSALVLLLLHLGTEGRAQLYAPEIKVEDTQGKVVVGNDQTATDLEVKGNIYGNIIRSSASLGTYGFEQNNMAVGNRGDAYGRGFSANGMGIFNQSTTAEDIYLINRNDGAADFLVLKNTGRVGINIINPGAKFHVMGSGQSWAGWFQNTNGADVRLGFKGGHGIFVNSTASGDPYLLHLNDHSTSRFIVKKSGGVGIGRGAHPHYLLAVQGKIYADGQVIPSDKKLKQDIKDYPMGLEVIKKLQPKKYKYRRKQKKLQVAGANDSGEEVIEEKTTVDENESIGVIAQELQAVAPDLVESFLDDDGEEVLAINHTALTYILINAVKELSQKVELLEESLAATKKNE